MPKQQSQEAFDRAQRALGVEPVPSPNKTNSSSHPKNSSSHAKTPKPKKKVDWQKAWLETDEEVRRSRKEADHLDKTKKESPPLYQHFFSDQRYPKAT